MTTLYLRCLSGHYASSTSSSYCAHNLRGFHFSTLRQAGHQRRPRSTRIIQAEYNSEPRSGRRQRSQTQQYVRERWEDTAPYEYAPSRNGRPPLPPEPPNNNGSNGNGGGGGGLDTVTKSIIAAAFLMGIGTGVWFNSEATFHPSNVASTEIIDRQTPNSEVCMANGYSSMVFDQRIFVSFNPFNVYVAQPEVKPGCVFRRSNIGLLEKKKLVTGQEVGACTKNLNTFAFVGDLDTSPEVSCVYHSEDAENQFLRNPRRAAMGDGFQLREGISDAAKAAGAATAKP